MPTSSSIDPFISQLAELCLRAPTRAKWVFVPAHAIGRMLGDRLVLEGLDWANFRFVTPLDIATRMGAPFLVERGIEPSEEGLGAALIMRLLLNLPQTVVILPPTRQSPRDGAGAVVHDSRAANGRHPFGRLEAEAFTSAEKHSEFQALYRSYEDIPRGPTAGTWRRSTKRR